MDPLPDARRTPRDLVRDAEALFGHDAIASWCEALLSGDATDDDPRHPDIAWLKGTIGWKPYWARVWGARGLLHLGPPLRPTIVLGALDDPQWRVREMALKVVAAHALPDPTGRVDALTRDENDRVRAAAWRALGLSADEAP